jgi:hypothetical protein
LEQKKKYKCSTRYCRNTIEIGTKCTTCRSRLSRENNQLKYSYNNLKSNAKRRGKDFDLTLEQFKQFCYKTDYLTGKGKTKTSYSIDRIDNNKGYSIDNIRVLTLSANSKKGTKILHYDWRTKEAIVTSTRIEVDIPPDEFCPF